MTALHTVITTHIEVIITEAVHMIAIIRNTGVTMVLRNLRVMELLQLFLLTLGQDILPAMAFPQLQLTLTPQPMLLRCGIRQPGALQCLLHRLQPILRLQVLLLMEPMLLLATISRPSGVSMQRGMQLKEVLAVPLGLIRVLLVALFLHRRRPHLHRHSNFYLVEFCFFKP